MIARLINEDARDAMTHPRRHSNGIHVNAMHALQPMRARRGGRHAPEHDEVGSPNNNKNNK